MIHVDEDNIICIVICAVDQAGESIGERRDRRQRKCRTQEKFLKQCKKGCLSAKFKHQMFAGESYQFNGFVTRSLMKDDRVHHENEDKLCDCEDYVEDFLKKLSLKTKKNN